MSTGKRRTFGVLLKSYRKAAGLTQEALAERASISGRAVSDLERGINRAPRPVTLALLARALELGEAERQQLEAAAGQPPAGWDFSDIAPYGPDRPSMVGREREIDLLERHLRGEGPPVLLLTGEPGIGKSRLLEVAEACAARYGYRALTGGCTQRDGQLPYAPLLEALERYIHQLSATHLRSALRGCAWLVRLLPELDQQGIEPLPQWAISAEQERRLVFRAVACFLANVAEPSGTLHILDDLQWAGPDALNLLVALMRTPIATPLRVVAAYRDTEILSSGPLTAALAGMAQARLAARHQLAPLAPDAVDRLLDRLFPDVVRPDGIANLRAAVRRQAGGVPFFVVSCAHAFQQDTAGGEGAAVPWDVEQSIHRRAALLPDVARQLLEVAAVAGREVRRTVLLLASGWQEEIVVEAVEAACGARLLEEYGLEGYRFPHDLIREAVEGSLGAARRALLHRRIGEVLERLPNAAPPAVLAHHYLRAGDRERAVVYLERAGDHACALGALTDAAGAYRDLVACLDQLGRDREAVQARESLGAVLFTMADYDGALAAWEQAAAALRMGTDVESLGRVLARVGRAHAMRGSVGEGLARLLPLLGPLAARGASSSLAALYGGISDLHRMGGQFRETLAAATQAAAVARAVGDDGLLAEADLERCWVLWNMGRDEEALSLLHEVSCLAGAAGTLGVLVDALATMALIFEDRGEFAVARLNAVRALTVAERLGDPAYIATVTVRLGALAFFSGNWTEARARLEGLSSLLDRNPLRDATLLDLGRLLLAEGAWEQAARYLEEANALGGRVGLGMIDRVAQSYLAELDILRGHPALAMARLAPLRDREGLGEEHVVTTYVLPALAWALLELGVLDRAMDVVAAAERRARAGRYRLSLVGVLRVRAMIAIPQGHWREAAAALSEGLALARGMPYPYGEARLLQVAGTLHGVMAERVAARKPLREALTIFQRLGAPRDIEWTERLLATFG
jgi:tetratricopeptide (TPR) repeat protein/transcriptional regulator with XRE-family HTH domain